jgi:hypothetical protein
MMSRPAGRDTELRRWGTPYVCIGGFSNCRCTAALGGGGNLGGGAGVQSARVVDASSPLSLSAHSIFSNPTDTACCTEQRNFFSNDKTWRTQILKTRITNSSNHKFYLSIYIVHKTWRKVFRSKHQKFCIFILLFIVEVQLQVSYLWNTLSSDVKYCLHVNKR